MRRTLLLTSLLFCAMGARAEEPFYEVEVSPEAYPPSAFTAKDTRSGTLPGRPKSRPALPGKEERERVFARVPGLEKDLAKMDQLDRDLLFLRARTRALKELQRLYPGVGKGKLSRLREELREK